jgi:hypothetical protein
VPEHPQRSGVDGFHDRVVNDLLDAEPGLALEDRQETVAFVRRQLAGMPVHLRLGVAGVAVLLGVLGRGRIDPDRWERSPLPFVPQYVRMLRSLVLFASYEPRLEDA